MKKWIYYSIGITPACAGKTMVQVQLVALPRDHTRVCGKNVTIAALEISCVGSHPRVREKHRQTANLLVLFGITPACAGKTYYVWLGFWPIQDHTRVCGKNLAVNVLPLWVIGSHPRVREKQIPSAIRRPLVRITPACAGKTYHKLLWYEQDQDHTRVCGKNRCIEL